MSDRPSTPTSAAPATDDRIATILSSVDNLRARGLAHRVAEDRQLFGRTITLDGRPVVNFGSCSYLGLETDERLKQAACDAVARYGVAFSSSRAYVSVPLYAELEARLSDMAGGYPVVIAPTTSLAHQAALPVLVGPGDAVLFDAMVHSSVQAVIPTLRQLGARCEPVPHNRMDRLAARLTTLAPAHQRIFYLADGVYSMHGDLVPMSELTELLERFPELFVYIDDAHGVGWTGRHGAGVALGTRPLHSRMAVALGLAKAFATGGAAIVLPRAELAARVFSCGGPLIFSGPVQPPQLGAAIASARIHLSGEITTLQLKLAQRIETFDALARAAGLSLRVRSPSPIRFVEIGDETEAAGAGCALLAAGFFVNVAVYPAVPRNRAGLRIVLNCRQTLDDVGALVRALVLLNRPRASGAAGSAG